MSWALPWVAKLKLGETVKFRPRGKSMTGKIDDGQLVTVEPVADPSVIREGDAVLCKVNGRYYLHLVKAVDEAASERFLIGNNCGHTNGWTTARNIFGKVVRVEP